MKFDETLFDWLGLKYRVSGDGWYVHCPFHKGGNEKTPSMGVNEKNGLIVFHCFACNASGTLPHLVASLKGLKTHEAIELLERKFHIDDYKSDSQLKKLEKVVVSIPHYETRWGKDGTLSEALLDLYDEKEPSGYMTRRGFKPVTLKRFEVGYDRWKERVIIPIRDEQNRLVGLVGRATGDAQPKYLFYDNFPKSKFVYGMGDVSDTELVVCEGHLDRMWLWQNGIRNSVALQGSQMSDAQAEWIAHTAEKIILWLDNDEAGRKGTERALEALRDMGKRKIYTVDWSGFPDAKDPTDFNLQGVAGMVKSSQFDALRNFLTKH